MYPGYRRGANLRRQSYRALQGSVSFEDMDLLPNEHPRDHRLRVAFLLNPTEESVSTVLTRSARRRVQALMHPFCATSGLNI